MPIADENRTDNRSRAGETKPPSLTARKRGFGAAFLLAFFLFGGISAPAAPPRQAHKSAKSTVLRARRANPKAAPLKAVRIPLNGDGSLPPFGPNTKVPNLPPDPQSLVSAGKMPAFYDASDLRKAPVLSAPSALLMDADTGQILWAKNPDEKHYPASTTKIMTGLLFVEHTKPTDVVTCLDPKITQIEESSLHIKPWEKFTAQDLLYGFILRSANDGAVVIAQHVSGTVPKFADLMNARARELGATNTHFVTPNGLHDPNHYTTARDLALIARAALQNPRFAEAVRLPTRTIARSIVTQDVVISSKAKKQFYDKFPGADGVKTGYTRKSLHCFVGSATRDGRRLLSVVLGAKNSAISDTTPLMSWGFKRFGATFVARKGEAAPPVSIRGGAAATVSTISAGDLHASFDTVSPGAPAPTVAGASAPTGTLTVQTRAESDGVSAPISKGQVVGRMIARVEETDIAQTPLLAAADVPRSALAAAAQSIAPPGQSGGKSVFPLLFWGAGALGAGLIGYRYYAAAVAKNARKRRRNRQAFAPAATPVRARDKK